MRPKQSGPQLLNIVTALCTLTLCMAGNPGEGPFPGRITSPQIVISPTITTELTLASKAADNCQLDFTLHEGAGVPLTDILVNGVDRGSAFFENLPPFAARRFVLTLDDGISEEKTGAATIDIATGSCRDAVNVQTSFTITNADGTKTEVFSYCPPPPIPMNRCAVAPVVFDPDRSDEIVRNPGYADVSFFPLNNVTRCMRLFNAAGAQLGSQFCESIDGRHRPKLLSEFFPNQTAFEGSWQVCYDGPAATPAAMPFVIDGLFLDVFESPSPSGNVIQLGTRDHHIDNPGCHPNETTHCDVFDRFSIKVTQVSGGQPVHIGNVKGDTPYFFFQADNQELLVRVFDGCSTNDHFWVFAASLTDVEYTITVTDTQTGASKIYDKPLSSPAITDTSAFATCP